MSLTGRNSSRPAVTPITQNGLPPLAGVEVRADGISKSLIPGRSSLNSDGAGWNGLALESYCSIAGCEIAEHEHPAHFLSLLIGSAVQTELTSEGKTWKELIEPGTIHLLPRGTRDRQSWSDPTSRIIVGIEPKFLARSTEETSTFDDVELETHWSLRDRHIAGLMLALQADLQDHQLAGRLYGEMLGATLAAYLVQRYATRPFRTVIRAGGLPMRRLKRVLDYIEANLASDISSSDVAAIAGMSPHHFGELFRRSMGESPHRFIMRRRFERAKDLLRDTELGILDVAMAVGFADQSHFTKVFHRLAGLTPGGFRASL
jgi:AraC family transcriptional regulator